MQLTALAIHEALPCGGNASGRGRAQMWKRTMKTIRALWGGSFWKNIEKIVLQSQ